MNEVANPKSSLDGLWVLLVANQGQMPIVGIDGRIPMMARTGNDETYLLGFKNMCKARNFIAQSSLQDAEPRMVVKGNKAEYIRIANQIGAAGVLVDYDPATNEYSSAEEIY